mmetsp:Transcript_7447/g.14195  ORF Transcript_7447/g.14195 Transcript_7447/m.14195 type:complete len:219 (+) Transcript_7447:4465-5121(+)
MGLVGLLVLVEVIKVDAAQRGPLTVTEADQVTTIALNSIFNSLQIGVLQNRQDTLGRIVRREGVLLSGLIQYFHEHFFSIGCHLFQGLCSISRTVHLLLGHIAHARPLLDGVNHNPTHIFNIEQVGHILRHSEDISLDLDHIFPQRMRKNVCKEALGKTALGSRGGGAIQKLPFGKGLCSVRVHNGVASLHHQVLGSFTELGAVDLREFCVRAIDPVE